MSRRPAVPPSLRRRPVLAVLVLALLATALPAATASAEEFGLGPSVTDRQVTIPARGSYVTSNFRCADPSHLIVGSGFKVDAVGKGQKRSDVRLLTNGTVVDDARRWIFNVRNLTRAPAQVRLFVTCVRRRTFSGSSTTHPRLVTPADAVSPAPYGPRCQPGELGVAPSYSLLPNPTSTTQAPVSEVTHHNLHVLNELAPDASGLPAENYWHVRLGSGQIAASGYRCLADRPGYTVFAYEAGTWGTTRTIPAAAPPGVPERLTTFRVGCESEDGHRLVAIAPQYDLTAGHPTVRLVTSEPSRGQFWDFTFANTGATAGQVKLDVLCVAA